MSVQYACGIALNRKNESMNCRAATTGSKKGGMALIYVIVVIVLISVLSVVLLRMIASSTAGYTTANSVNQARCIAEAGLHYAAAQTEEELETLQASGPSAFTLGENGTFTLWVGTKGARTPDMYPVQSSSVVNPGTEIAATYNLFADILPRTTNGP
jgi:type II secretory pathway pseudopilin PulG